MSANSVGSRQRSAQMMIYVTLFAGITGFVYQLLLDGALLTFVVTAAAIGGLVGVSKEFDERERQLLWQSYAKAFEYLFSSIFFAYALILLASGLHLGGSVVEFINTHWLSSVASLMCIILGAVGIRYFREELDI